MFATPAQCLARPTAHGLAREFRRFGAPGAEGRLPCRRSRDRSVGGPMVLNQCAVRMSVALCRSMNDDIFGPYDGGLHSDQCCAGPVPCRHISSAQTLFRHLQRKLGFAFERLATGAAGISGRKGIVFFDDVFIRRNGTAGDHIDFWDGRTYTNEATGAGAPTGDLPMFDDARRGVWFCQL